ncbi:MAG: hypothetical protein NT175_01570 [Bacteroidetes bacterium]|nr:hypothetical protein [Bacteroidota bacterium]
METFLEILKYIIPALVVFVTVFIVLKAFLENDRNKRQAEVKTDREKILIPLKTQAYERLVLFLERLTPGNLVLRVSRPEMNVIQLQAALIKSIRDEYEHNMSQQLYVSDEAWQMIKNAKEDIIRLINISAAQVNPSARSSEMAGILLESYLKNENPPVVSGMNFIKEEFRNLS